MVARNETGKGMQGPDFEGELHMKNLEFILVSSGKLFNFKQRSETIRFMV